MGFRTVGRVVDKWCAMPTPTFEGWIWPAPSGEEGTLQYYLRVAALHPQTEQTSRWTVACISQAQWERYPIGSWLRLWLGGWAPLMRFVTIAE